MPADILDPSAIISSLPTLLPPNSKSLTSPQDAIAALLHSALTALAFRLIAVDESSTGANLSSSVLPDHWNKSGPGNYTLKYRHDQSSLEFVVKLSKLGTRTLINAIALESDRVATLDICTNDFTSPSFYPYNLDAPDASPLVHGYISSNRVADLLSQLKLKIIQKLVPGLQKEGYTEETDSSAGSSSSANPPSRDPTAPRPRPESPPDAPGRYPYYPQSAIPRNPLEIGRRDLDPFPANPFAPPSLFPQHGGDGMFVGPEHPIFGIGRGDNSPLRGPWGGDGYLPPMGAPPGARFDPVGPGFPNRGPGPFGGPFSGSGRGRRPENPDNDEFMPPGMVSSKFIDIITFSTTLIGFQGDMFM
ncbi:Proteasome inhibitor PI31 subunit [Psilocybe cubensis]|uniref:Proteasome inhibitor PI31 subunit n=1 Tax=Psilocybe cubensis TaxID=181762 RepID=A0ACB8H3E2_PSICU|nr:Proteasome inhibitor PI31 subunit [Psilocybe cubensis]KAH9482391.1 Proteasome inhibitor PI31 subunit [Psilocybe cubensis]